MKIAVCDDETTFNNEMLAVINRMYQSLDMTVDTFTGGNALLEHFQAEPYDLVFLDIEMPDINGIALAGKLREQDQDVTIVFLTGHQEYAIDGYGFNALCYMLKPVDQEKIHAVLERALEIQSKKKFIWVTNRDGTHRIRISDLISIEAHNQNLIFNTTSGSIEARGNIRNYEKELKYDGFFRLHRSYIVSLSQITKISEKEVLAGRFRAPIARSKAQEFQKALFSFANQEFF